MLEQAACVLLPCSQPENILAISRRNDTSQWGIPGGKVDPGETNLSAAVREIAEETGLTLPPELLHPVYAGVCYGQDGRNFWVTTYCVDLPPRDWTAEPSLQPEPGFELKIMSMAALCDHAISPFASYNEHVTRAWQSYRNA